MEINNRKTSSILDLGKVDIEVLSRKVKQLDATDWDTPEDYAANYNKHPNSVLNKTAHLIFRFTNKQKNPFEYFNCSRWESWKEILLPVIEEATKVYAYEYGMATRVMLAKLPPKSFIAPHTDGTSNGSIPHKIHIPIETNKDSFFYVEEEKFHFKEGRAYEVNNSAKHAVANNGSTDRIHLIFEYLDYNAQSSIIQQQLNQF